MKVEFIFGGWQGVDAVPVAWIPVLLRCMEPKEPAAGHFGDFFATALVRTPNDGRDHIDASVWIAFVDLQGFKCELPHSKRSTENNFEKQRSVKYTVVHRVHGRSGWIPLRVPQYF